MRATQERGKPNSMGSAPPAGRAALTAVLLALGFVFLWVIHPTATWVGLLTVSYLLPTLYSSPLVRLKERGAAGVISDALAAHLLPMLLIGLTLRTLGEGGNSRWLGLTVMAIVWSFCVGLRGVMIHHALDREGDLRAGVMTFAAARSLESVRKFVVVAVLPVEALAVTGFVLFLPAWTPVVITVLGVFVAGEIARVARGLRMPMVHVDEPGRERYVPLVSNELYEVWLPCALVVQMVLMDPAYGPLAILHAVLFRKPILRTLRMLTAFLHRAVRYAG